MKDDKTIKLLFLISTILVAWLIKIIAFDGFLTFFLARILPSSISGR